MSIAPDWMRQSRVYMRTPDGRVREGIDITDLLGGATEECPVCYARLTLGRLNEHLASLHSGAEAEAPDPSRPVPSRPK